MLEIDEIQVRRIVRKKIYEVQRLHLFFTEQYNSINGKNNFALFK